MNEIGIILEDMGLRPAGHSLDRYPDQKGDYGPDNCRWATTVQQCRNRKNTVFIELRGERMPLAEACERFSVKYKSAITLWRGGRSAEQIFNRGDRHAS